MSASHPQSGASPCRTDRPAVGVVCMSYGVVVSDDVVVPVAPSSRLVVVARVVAVLVVVAAFAHWLTGPVERSLGDLLRGLESGEVTRIVLGVPAEEGMIGGFAQRVEWEGPGRDGYATYEVSTLPGEMKDEDALIVQAVPDSPASVVVERRDEYWFGPTGMRWNPLGIVHLVMLLVLIGGPQPRWATKWAWFWLSFLPLGWAVFLLLEPVPVWRRTPSYPPERRFTGGGCGSPPSSPRAFSPS